MMKHAPTLAGATMRQLAYPRPTVTDYGTIALMASDMGLLLPGLSGASLSNPTAPGGGGGGGSGDYGGSGGGGDQGSPGNTVDVGGVNTTGGGGGSSGGGGSPGGGAELAGGSGGGRSEHPFTGFPAALVAAVGGTLSATGAALRRALRIDDD
jgi:hypothetical protein